jgi:hypothetical protein
MSTLESVSEAAAKVASGDTETAAEGVTDLLQMAAGGYGAYAGITRLKPFKVRHAAAKLADEAADVADAASDAARGAARVGPRVARQMGPRGWTQEAIDEAIKSGQQIKAVNRATGNAATRHVHPITGQSVVVDNVTGEVIHVGGPGFKYGPESGDLP